MKKAMPTPYNVHSIAELHRILHLPKPAHPLVSVINFSDVTCFLDESLKTVLYNFYSVCIKKDFKGKVKYGQQYYDFDEGVMTFFSPGQIISTEMTADTALKGWWLTIHPDFIRMYPLAKSIKNYGYFSYAVHEALHLSEKEESMITSIMHHIDEEYRAAIDHFSQDVMVAHIELLLNYSNRFYNRQFITRKHASNDLLLQVNSLLDDYFNSNTMEAGLPSVRYISDKLNVSANYLSDMLRNVTGQNTQQHIHYKLIEKAKEILTSTSLSVSEIAYQLGFEYPQSFSKLFKNKTNVSPLAFRQSFN